MADWLNKNEKEIKKSKKALRKTRSSVEEAKGQRRTTEVNARLDTLICTNCNCKLTAHSTMYNLCVHSFPYSLIQYTCQLSSGWVSEQVSWHPWQPFSSFFLCYSILPCPYIVHASPTSVSPPVSPWLYQLSQITSPNTPSFEDVPCLGSVYVKHKPTYFQLYTGSGYIANLHLPPLP